MPELTAEQIEAVKNLLQRVALLEDEVLPQVTTQLTSLNNLANGLARRFHTVDGAAIQQQLSDLGAEIHSYIAENFVSKASNLNSNNAICVKAPQPFSGQASYIDSFFTQLQVVFLADSSKFSNNDENKVLYTINCLAGTALNYVLPFIKDIDPSNKPEMLTNFTTFTRLLYSAFADSNPTVNAEGALRNLKHTGSAAVYASEFRRLSILLSWNNDALVSQYLLNLKDTIKDELARRDPIKELNDLMNISIDIDNRLFARNKQKLGNQPRPVQQRYVTKPETTPMDLNAVSTHNNNFLPRGPLTQDEKDRRRRLNLCVYCAMPGHLLPLAQTRTVTSLVALPSQLS
ncbi:hypothetical protein INT47_002980 [Mucor saturninus]|uniref:Ty3 transposon capsid-like protein domain-containing protein n=1 Tax=Mucor saturninus TaxID=64648 RepID=A0A8H7QUE1_9FUNG|nr:hypothetical protein INT47_002980 [Mucor saturninus]